MKTMKVKILVAMCDNGHWAASGWGRKGRRTDEVSVEAMKDTVSDLIESEQYHYVWVEAEVPIPEVTKIYGKVVKTELPG